ncbi:MAG: phosphoglycerate kinase, partial [Dietzia sp.]|nr:phosphoglycerate kinase [Dietzia sp.]
MAVSTLQDLLDAGVEGRKILVRCDLNVPLDGSTITDSGRITASLPTLNALLDAGAALVITAHLGRPKGAADPAFSLAPVAEKLGDELGRYVQLAGDVVGPDARERANGLTDGDVLLVENIRFDPRETSKDPAERAALAAELASLVGEDGAFVSNGFGVVHRAQASVCDIAEVLPAYAGDLVQSEVEVRGEVEFDVAREE